VSRGPQRAGTSRVPRWWLLLLIIALAGALVWWWGLSRKWDVTIQFLRFEGTGGERVAPTSRDGASFAVFEIANRSGEGLLLPYQVAQLTIEVFSPDGKGTTYAPEPEGRWMEMASGESKQAKIPLRCPDGTPITGAFRVGFEFRDKRGVRRYEAVDRLPGWASRWIQQVLPKSYFQDRTHVYWTEVVTP
jgi:hypothetical protein